MSTYPPKKCGIASFSKDLRDNLSRLGEQASVAAVSDPFYDYDYPDEVSYIVRQRELKDYLSLANNVNNNDKIDMVIIQHEYGIYGGDDGEYLLSFASQLRKPFLLVTHTVLPVPSHKQRMILACLCQWASAIVAMTKSSASLLSRLYAAPSEKIFIIHHGVPAFKLRDGKELKRQHGYDGRDLITTFGLIGPGKGLEIGIRTLKNLVEKHDHLLYLIVGGTHPMLLQHEGERYREMLSQGQRGMVSASAAPESLAELLDRVLSEPDLKLMLEHGAARLGDRMKWPYIAKQYASLAGSLIKTNIASQMGA
jgi:glycosyltransferase involved in cell wall biosynthesis